MPLNFINPVLHPFGRNVPYREGCLSITKVYADVLRRSCVKAILTLVDGRTVTIKCNGSWRAACSTRWTIFREACSRTWFPRRTMTRWCGGSG